MDATFFSRHIAPILLLSAGKDSAACMWLLQPLWGRIVFVWANPGDPEPLAIEYMKHVRALVPNFVELTGSIVREANPWACCSRNLWSLLAEAQAAPGVTGCIAGVKKCDTLRSPVHQPGAVLNGVEHAFPVWDWTDDEVIQFLGDRLPPSYAQGHKTSLDCAGCTAWSH